MPTWVSFIGLRERVSIQDILEHYGMLGKLNRQGDELVGQCPFHEDRRPSFSANISKNVFHCFAGGCGKKGDILDFVARKEGVDVRQAARPAAFIDVGGSFTGSGQPVRSWSLAQAGLPGNHPQCGTR